MNAYGIIEVSGMGAAYVAIDAMLKVADIEMVTWEKKLGGRLVSIVIKGDVSSVHEAINHGEVAANRITKTVAKAFINNPHEEVVKIANESAKKYPFAIQED